MSGYDRNIVEQLWNAGYDLGQIVKRYRSKSESLRFLKQLNYYRENNYNKFADYLLSIYLDLGLAISESVQNIVVNELQAKKYAVIFCMGYIGENKIKDAN